MRPRHSSFVPRLRRVLSGLFLLALVAPGAALANDLTLTPGNPASNGVPATVVASGSSDFASGQVSVFRVVSQGYGCPTSYSAASAQGVALDSGHSITASGPFSFEDQNSGTQSPGTTYLLCGYLMSPSGTTIAQTAPYTVPGTPPGTSAPAVVTGGGSDAGSGGSMLSGTVDPHGLDTTYAVEYGATKAYGQSAAGDGAIGGTVAHPQPVNVLIPPLPAGTTIHYRLVATNAAGTGQGADRVYTTPGGVPDVTTGPADAITIDGFTMHGSYNPHGRSGAVFEYTVAPVGSSVVRTTAPLPPVAEENAGSENAASAAVPHGFLDQYAARWPQTEAFGRTFPDVEPTVTVAYRLVVGGTAGAWRTVTSPAPTRAPTVTTGAAKGTRCGDVGPCILLSGTVDDHGQGYSLPLFEVGPTASYGKLCQGIVDHRDQAGGTLPSSGPYPVTGVYCHSPYFKPGATIHYRLGAANGGPGGVIYGPDRTFTVPGGSAGPAGPALSRSLRVSAGIGALLESGGYTTTFSAPGPGVAAISWYSRPKSILVATVRKTVSGKGSVTLDVKLTAKGRALLRKVKQGQKLKLTAKGSFASNGGGKTTKKKTFSLARDGG